MLHLLLHALLLLAVLAASPSAWAAGFPRPRPVYGEEVAVLPMVELRGDPRRVYVLVDDPELGSRVFFVDTAFSRTTCDDDFVAELGLEVQRTLRWSRGELGNIRLGRAVLPPFVIGGHEIPRLACAVRDLDSTSSVASSPEQPVAGVLGANLFARFVVIIDPRARTVTLLEPAVHPVEDGPGVVRLRREHGLGPRVRLPLVVDGETTWPLLDTGATRTHLDARRLDLPLVEERLGMARGSGSTNQEATTFRIHEIQDVSLSGHHQGPVRIIDRRRAPWVPGLAGQDILGGYLLRIDTRHRRLGVEEPAPPEQPRGRGL